MGGRYLTKSQVEKIKKAERGVQEPMTLNSKAYQEMKKQWEEESKRYESNQQGERNG